ncbi:MAG TPA: hypothetical protein PKC24_06505 [Cyclobacteriaceae bacterium]|nr:hypothetical protein [Cyclobacteriaceae bacterium]
MKLLSRSIIYFSVVLTSLTAHAQNGFQEGYIITNNGDTINGFIKDRREGSFADLYKQVRFKGKGMFTKKYSAHQISGYKRGNDIFESHWFEQDRRLLKENYYSRKGAGRKVFLKVVESAYLSLYYKEFLDQESGFVDYFPLFKREDEDYFVRVTQGISGLKKKRLAEYFRDCPDVLEQIENNMLKTPMQIAEYYNLNCRIKPVK